MFLTKFTQILFPKYQAQLHSRIMVTHLYAKYQKNSTSQSREKLSTNERTNIRRLIWEL